MWAIVRLIVVGLAGAGITKLADTYLKPFLPDQIKPAEPLYPGRLLSMRTIWLIAFGALSTMIVVYVGRLLNIRFLKAKF